GAHGDRGRGSPRREDRNRDRAEVPGALRRGDRHPLERGRRRRRAPQTAARTEDGMSRRTGGRAGRQAARLHAVAEKVPFITRTMAPVEVLSEEGLDLVIENADTILEQVGIDFRDEEALSAWRDAGADVQGERVRFARGMCRQLVQATA